MSSEVQTANEATFEFDEIFQDTIPQSAVFKKVAIPFIRKLFSGQNSMILAYGITNAGKTHTILGTEAEPGLIPRSIDAIFYSLKDKIIQSPRRDEKESAKYLIECCRSVLFNAKDENWNSFTDSFSDPVTGVPGLFTDEKENNISLLSGNESLLFQVAVSYFEIYNDRCYDLFDVDTLLEAQKILKRGQKSTTKYRRQGLKLKEVQNGKIKIEGLHEIEVSSSSEVHRLLQCGLKNRQIAETLCNRHSSRSHTVFNVNLKALQKVSKKEYRLDFQSTLSFVDLAGSERTTKTNVSGERLKETAQINKSLMNLGQCLEALRRNQRIRESKDEENPKRKLLLVPYRQSKLTLLFRDFLQNGSTVMIAACSPASSDADETIHALRTASFAKELKYSHIQVYGNPNLFSNQTKHLNELRHTTTERNQSDDDTAKLMVNDERFQDFDELLLEIESLRERLAFAESRALIIESEIRDEVAREMEEALHKMEKQFRVKLEEATQFHEERLEKRVHLITTTARKELGYGAAHRAAEHAMLNYYKDKWEAERSLHEFELSQLKQKLRERNLERDQLKELLSDRTTTNEKVSRQNVFTQTEDFAEPQKQISKKLDNRNELSNLLENFVETVKRFTQHLFGEDTWQQIENSYLVSMIEELAQEECEIGQIHIIRRHGIDPTNHESLPDMNQNKRRRERRKKQTEISNESYQVNTKNDSIEATDCSDGFDNSTSFLSTTTPDKVIKKSRRSRKTKK
ncbi:Kinesin-like protein KIF20A [Galdieria sulphuraria]|nr:Kinesin-like protein KIF20A [Galdieria sulphuraria]